MTFKTFYFYLISFILFALLWAHVAPQIYSLYGANQVAKEVDCKVGGTFYVTELSFDFKIQCPESDRERINQMFYQIK